MRLPIVRKHRQPGFSLIELIIVIVILGIIGAMVAVFMKTPIDAYVASASRAALTDVADTTLRRIGRDLHRALPNSVRISPDNQCIEFIPTKTGGRYRTSERSAGDGSSLDSSIADASFNMLGSNNALPVAQRIATGDVVVVYNQNEGNGNTSAYSGNNTAVVLGVGLETAAPVETPINIVSTKFSAPAVSAESDSKRFQVVPAEEWVVAYVCSGGLLRRNVSSGSFASPCSAAGPVMANNARCVFVNEGVYSPHNALYRMQLWLTENGETVTLQHQVHVNNSP